MKSTAHLRYLRIAPRKVRLATDLIRGMNVLEAKRSLGFLQKKAALPVLKTLNSAVASAKSNFQAEESNLYIAKILVNEGPKLQRFRARAQGRVYPIQKKTSHITIVLEEMEQGKRAAAPTGASPKKGGQRARKAEKTPRRPERQESMPRKQSPGIAQRIFRRKSV